MFELAEPSVNIDADLITDVQLQDASATSRRMTNQNLMSLWLEAIAIRLEAIATTMCMRKKM